MSKRRRPAAARRLAEQRFWGRTDDAGETEAEAKKAPVQIRPTSDPAALVRSLGAPPLAMDSAVVDRHLTAVYEEAVRAATALAAANGLLASDDEGVGD
jgi:uncharacterized Zn finger protein